MQPPPTPLTYEAEGQPKVGRQFSAEVIVDGDTEEVRLLDELGLGARDGDVEFVEHGVVLGEGRVG